MCGRCRVACSDWCAVDGGRTVRPGHRRRSENVPEQRRLARRRVSPARHWPRSGRRVSASRMSAVAASLVALIRSPSLPPSSLEVQLHMCSAIRQMDRLHEHAQPSATAPLGLFSCDMPCDASITHRRLGRVGRRRTCPNGGPGRRRGRADHRWRLVGPGDDHARTTSARPVSPPVVSAPSYRPTDIDLALVYDGFTFDSDLVDRGPRLLQEVGEGRKELDRRRTAYRAQRPLPAEPARGPVVRGAHPRLRVPVRGDDATAPRSRRAAGADATLLRWSRQGGGTPSGVLLLRRDSWAPPHVARRNVG